MKELINNISESGLWIFTSLAAVILSGIIKYIVSNYYNRKEKRTITLNMKKGDSNLEIKNIDIKDINIEEIIKKLEEQTKARDEH